jgi:cyclohexanecarboxyl-CoA dehydrogenase
MDFTFSPDQDALRETVRRFAEQVVAPASKQLDVDQRIPDGILAGLAELGVLAMCVPTELGGGGASSIDLGIVVEELAAADFVIGQLPIMGGLVAQAISQATPAVREAALPALIEGRTLVAFALTEPEAGSDALQLRCRAERTPTGYRISGEKTSISNLGGASACVVLAQLEASRAETGGVTAFYVPLDAAGVSTGLFDDIGCRAIARGRLALDGVELPASHRIGEEGGGFRLVMSIFDLTRTVIGLAAVATATRAIHDAAAYSRERYAFGAPIAANQGVSFPLAEHLTRLEAARWLCYRALWLRDSSVPHTVEAAMCKWWCVVEALDAIHTAMLVHGTPVTRASCRMGSGSGT